MNQNMNHASDLDPDGLFHGIPDDTRIMDTSEMLSDQFAQKVDHDLKKEIERGKKRRIILRSLLSAAILLVVIHAIGLFKFPREKDIPKNPVIIGDLFPGAGGAQNGALSNMTMEEREGQMQIAADANYFTFKISDRLVLEDGKSEGYIGIENPNYNVYPMVIQIFLGEDGEGGLIYDSGGILPNQHVDNARLLKKLPKGAYHALAYLYAYDPETHANLFKSTSPLTINIEN